MAETKREEHERLQERTEELRRHTRDLGIDRTPFNGANHKQHLDNLAEHLAELQAHKRRDSDERSD